MKWIELPGGCSPLYPKEFKRNSGAPCVIGLCREGVSEFNCPSSRGEVIIESMNDYTKERRS
jgi:hypothetical protein